MVPSLSFEGLVGSVFLVLFVLLLLVLLATAVLGTPLYVFDAGIRNLAHRPPADAVQFFTAVGAAVVILGLAAISLR